MSPWVQVAIGCAGGLGLSWALLRWVAPLGWLDHPDEARKHHVRPTARTAGLALWIGLIAAQVSGVVPFRLDRADWCGIHAMALIGLLDDRFDLRARYKALAGLTVALLLAFHVTRSLGPTMGQVPFLGIDLPAHPALIFPLLMLWFWAVPQAYNLIDGINGLSMGFAALLLGVLGWNLGVQSAFLWGGLAAVLALNFPRAHHFLGDCGALMLGTLFAILGIEAFGQRAPDLLLWVFAYPIMDVTLVVGIRRWKGEPLSGADRNHLHHWMMEQMGGRAWLATPLLLGLAALPMAHALPFPGHLALSTLGLVALGVVAFKAFKDRVTQPKASEEAVEAKALVRRVIPLMVCSKLREASGSHSKL